jgi:hypothetical protein
MTQEQFILWLEGFLDGKELSVNPALVKIKEKFDSIQPFHKHTIYPPHQFGTPNQVNPFYVGDVPYQPYYTTSTGINPMGRPDVTTAKVDSTPTSEKQLLNENEG